MRIFWSAVMLSGFGLGLIGMNGLSQTTSPAPAPAAQGSPSKDDLPDGPGKEVVKRMCVGCHSLKTVTSKHQTPEEWASTVDLMVSRGADGSDEDIDKVVKYLSAHFGPVKDGAAPSTPPPSDQKQ